MYLVLTEGKIATYTSFQERVGDEYGGGTNESQDKEFPFTRCRLLEGRMNGKKSRQILVLMIGHCP